MSITSRSVNFGARNTGLSTVGYTLYNPDRTVNRARSKDDVAELIVGTGIYSANISFPQEFKGHLIWDTGEATPTYAAENVDFELIPGLSSFGIIQGVMDDKDKRRLFNLLKKIKAILDSVQSKDLSGQFKQIENLIINTVSSISSVREALSNVSEESKARAIVDMAKIESDMGVIAEGLGSLMESKQLDGMIKEVDEHARTKTTELED